MTTPEKKISAFAQLDTVAEDGVLVANQTSTGPTGGLPIPALRTRLNTGDQSFTADVDVAGKVSANQLEGNGALISGVVAAGTGGTSSTGSLQLVANSDNSTPAAKVQISKYSTSLADLDETGLELKTGIPYSHQDDYAPFDKGIDLSNNRMIRNQTIIDQTTEPFYWLNGPSGSLLVADNAAYSELFKYGGTYICKYNATTTGEQNSGRFFEKGTFLAFISGPKIYFAVPFSGDNGVWQSTNTITIEKDSIIGVSYDGSSTANNPTIYLDGKEVALTQMTPPTGTISTDVGSDLYLGNRSGDDRTFHGSRKGDLFLNRAMTAAELEKWTSNPQMALDYADEGGSNAELITGWTNSDFDTFTSSGVDITQAVSDGAGFDNCYRGLNVIKGKTYVFDFTVGGTVGTNLTFRINSATGLAGTSYKNTSISAVGDYTATWTATVDGTVYIGFASNLSACDFSISNWYSRKLGATAVYKGRDFTAELAKDSSGNDNHATVSGATLCNKSEQLTEEYGTWTPTLATWTFTITEAEYIKRGREVTVSAYLTGTGGTAPTDSQTFGGLPYTTSNNGCGAAVLLDQSDSFSRHILPLSVASGSTDFVIANNDSGITIANNDRYILTLTYFTNS